MLDEAVAEYEPAAQIVQTEDPASEYEPAMHAPVAAVRPEVAQNAPAGLAVHAVEPVDAIYVPARQLEQLDEDAEVEYDPDKHLEHTVDEAIEYDPAAHAPDTAVRPVVAQYEPPGHIEQLKEPALA